MAQNQVYLIKSGDGSFIEETEAIIGISGGKLGVGTTAPEASLHVTGDVKVGGNLSVDGTLTTINSNEITVDDKNIELGSVDSPTNITADGGGITLKGTTDKTIIWSNATDAWEFSEHVRLADNMQFQADQLRARDAGGLVVGDDAGNGIFIEDGGQVGINQTSPAYDLDVVGSGNFSQGLYVQGNSVLTGSASDLGKWQDGAEAGEIYYTAGNIGVGVENPSSKLHVIGNTLLNGSLTVAGETGKFDVSDFRISGKTINLNYNGADAGFDAGLYLQTNAGEEYIKYNNLNNAWVSSKNIEIDDNYGLKSQKISAKDAGGIRIEDDAGNGVELKDGGNLSVENDLIVSGNLRVEGTQVIVNTETLKVEDHNVEIAANTGSETLVDAGITWGTGDEVSLTYTNSEGFSFSGRDSDSISFNGVNILTGSVSDLGKWQDGTEAGEIYYSDGNVGIKTDNPNYDLDVNGTIGAQNGAFSTSLTVGGNNVLTGNTSDLGKWQEGSTFGEIYYSNGNVGIGTDNPESDLDVSGTAKFDRVELGSQFVFDSDGTVGGGTPQVGDVLMYQGGYWGVAANNPGGLLTGEIPKAFVRTLTVGESIHPIEFVQDLTAVPAISTNLEIAGDGEIIPYVLSGVSETGYYAVFAQNIPSVGYKIHTTFGGKDVFWETGINSIYFDRGDVLLSDKLTVSGNLDVEGAAGINITNDLTVGGDLTVNGSTTTINTQELTVEDKNIVIASNITSTSASMTEAGITWGNNDAVKLLYTKDLGFSFNGGNVGIGTTNPGSKLTLENGDIKLQRTDAGNSKIIFSNTSDNMWAIAGDADGDFTLERRVKATNAFINRALTIESVTTEAMRIDSDGNVGIGTTNPDYDLDVHGWINAQADALSTDAVINLVGSNASSYSAISRIKSTSESPSNGSSSLTFSTRDSTNSINERMRIDSDGNVGIGNTQPGHDLCLGSATSAGTTESRLKIFRGADDANQNLEMGYAGITVTRDNVPLASSQSTFSIRQKGSDGQRTPFLIGSDGNVGIGTTSPAATAKLDVDGRINAESLLITANSSIGLGIQNTDNTNSAYIKNIGSSGVTLLNIDDKVYVKENGHVGIGTTGPDRKLHIADGFIRVDDGYGIDTSGSTEKIVLDNGFISLTTNSNEAIRINSDGDVGIGTSGPDSQYKLDVRGSVRMQEKLRILGTTTSSGSAHILLQNNFNTASRNFYIGNDYTGSATSPNGLSIKTSAYNVSDWGSASPAIMHFTHTRNVGIGTTNPTNALNVVSSSGTGIPVAWIHNSNNTESGDHGTVISTIHNHADINVLSVRSNNSTHTNGNLLFTVKGDGKVGIGTTSPSAVFHVEKESDQSFNSPHFKIKGNAYSGLHWLNNTAYYIGQDFTERSIRIFSGSPATGVALTNGSNSWATFSDERLKENITNLDSVIDKIKDIRCVSYTRSDVENSKEAIGFIAQDFIGKFDQVLNKSKISDEDEGEYYSIKYTETIPVLMKAIQEQQSLIEDLKSQNESLIQRIENLENK